jgi:hypothetical protein
MSDERPFNADAIAAALAHVAVAQGDTASVAALAVSVPKLMETGYDNWNGGIYLNNGHGKQKSHCLRLDRHLVSLASLSGAL